MRTIAVINQKGGVGKTTTSVNLAAGLARAGRRVCLLDLDPQGHASLHLGIEAVGGSDSVYQVFTGNRTLNDVRQLTTQNLWVVPSDLDLAATELELVDAPGREYVLRNAVEASQLSRDFDYLLMDCPPSLGVLTINALCLAREVFIPLQPHFFALHGLSKLLETTALVARRINPAVKVSGIVICLYDATTKLAQEVVTDLAAFLAQSRGANVPWAAAKVFDTKVRRNVKLAECPSFGKTIFEYAPKSPGAEDYAALAGEVAGPIEIGVPVAELSVV